MTVIVGLAPDAADVPAESNATTPRSSAMFFA
jgi:hypothetical protein